MFSGQRSRSATFALGSHGEDETREADEPDDYDDNNLMLQ
jgi:hypothetical protein